MDTASVRPFVAVLAGAILVAFNCCILGPHQIYASNESEFQSTYREVLPLLLLAGLVLTALLSAVAMLLPSRWKTTYATALIGVGFLLWIQGSLIRWDYGDFNGTNIDWSQNAWRGWLDLTIWLVLGAAVLRFRRTVLRGARLVVPAFIALQAGLIVVGKSRSGDGAYGNSRGGASRGASEVPVDVCRISKSTNVFQIILDSFQTDVFLELVEDEGLAETLDGFVVYRDNAAPAAQTILCIPAIMSGKQYDGAMLPSENYRTAAREGFHNQLAAQGYVVNLMPYIEMPGARCSGYYLSPRTYVWPRRTRLLQASSFMIDVGMFRQSPHFLKRAVYNSRNWRLSGVIATPPNHVSLHQKEFFRDYIDKLEIAHDRPAYHFLHLSPPHPPYVTNADGSYAGEALPDTRDNFKNEARYVLRLVIDFLNKLRELDAYDDSIVIVQGDHGSTFPAVFDDEEYPVPVNRLLALLAVKPADAHGPLGTSNAPTTAADVPATVLDLLGISHSYDGASVVDMADDLVRQREYVVFENEPSRGRMLQRWVIDGSIYDPASFRELEAREIQVALRDYAWGNRLSFGVAGIGGPYLTRGWTPSRAMHWSSGHEAQMRFRVEPPPEDVVFKMTFFFHIVPGEVERQRLRISVNGEFVGEHETRSPEPQEFSQIVPRDLLNTNVLTIDLEFPDAALLAENRKVATRRAMALWSFRAELASQAN